ncbi:MAG: dipeptide epimerase [Acidobacteria bacterium]|nr:dipeptide epimerase [Acidobacteriota bacterium]
MIRVLSAEAAPVTFRLVEGYRIAGRSFTSAWNAILKVTTSDGRTGFGCAAPAEDVTGETPDRCLRALRDRLVPILRESDAADPAAVAARAAAAAPEAPAARAAVEMALLDLAGIRANAPLVRILGMRRGRLPTSITIGIAGPEETLAKARSSVASGYRFLKVKVGDDWEIDSRRVRLLRESLDPGVVLRADGNQGYTAEDARRFLAALRPGDLDLLEEPTATADLATLRPLAEARGIPLMADESIRTVDEAARIIEARAVHLVNLKLMKSGGIAASGAIARLAEGAGMRAMIGCMDESRIGIAAALHCALALPAVDRADLDGHLDLADDVARYGVRIERGYVLPALGRPGLGVSVDL